MLKKSRENNSDNGQRWERICQLPLLGNKGVSEVIGREETRVWPGQGRPLPLVSSELGNSAK